MPRYLIPEPAEASLTTLGDALDLVDFGIVLLNRDLRIRCINSRFSEMWKMEAAFFEPAPSFRELLVGAAALGWYQIADADLPAYIDQREADVHAGSVPPTLLELSDSRRFLFRCVATSDGGRILTYTDISNELQREASDAITRMTAELRFNTEMLEDQAAHLAALAEAAEDNAQKAEAARQLLEQEIAERRQLEVSLRRMATTDGLTGACNRAELLAVSQARLQAAAVTGQSLAVLMLDVDHFKAINDRFGHAGGDCALQHLVGTLYGGIQQIDLLGRLGGEEFAIVLIDIASSTAEAMAERLRARVAETPAIFGDRIIPMTVSIGLASRIVSDLSIEQVLARADDALYRAKGGGRNRVITYERLQVA